MDVVPQRFVAEFPIARLREDPENPWVGDDEGIGQSIDVLGFYGAVLVQEGSDRLIAGHTRRRQALDRGATTVPALVLDVDDDTARRILVRDNHRGRGKFADEPLKVVLELLQRDKRGLLGSGFSDEDLGKVTARLDNPGMRATHTRRLVQFEAEERPLCPHCGQRMPRVDDGS